MSFSRWKPLMRSVTLVAVAAFFSAVYAAAQSTPSQDQTGSSSSQTGLSASGLELTEFALPESSDPGGSAGSASEGGAGQYGQGGGYGGGSKHGYLHQYAFEAGGGFNGPIGNDTGSSGNPVPVITWGGNFTLGGGLRFTNRVSGLLEYQFIADKLPGAYIAQYLDEVGATAGNSHINSITASPVVDLFPKKSNGIYAVGGWGFYHKSTNFQTPEYQESIYYGTYAQNVTIASATSNQWGGNLGLGIYHRLGGMYASDSHTQLFAEARYTFLHTPSVTPVVEGTPVPTNSGATTGLGGTTELIPVTLGVRF